MTIAISKSPILVSLVFLSAISLSCSRSGSSTQPADHNGATAESRRPADLVANVKAATAAFEKWMKDPVGINDKNENASGFGCDLRKTDSLVSPYVASVSWFPTGQKGPTPQPVKGDTVIEYVFAHQDGRWTFTKGTWTAYHYDGRVHVSEAGNEKQIAKLEQLLNP